jgi:OOP family OmpA-OmpF porin
MKRLALGAALLATAASTFAADGGWYIGGGVGQSEFGDCSGTCDTDKNAYKVFAGYRLSRHLALEAGYVDLGKFTVASGASLAETKPRGVAGHVVGLWPLSERISILGRLGLIYGDSKVTGSEPARNDRGTQVAWGLGAQYEVGREFIVRLDWDRYRFKAAGGSMDVDAAMLVFITSF